MVTLLLIRYEQDRYHVDEFIRQYFDDYDLKMMDGGDHLSEHEQETHVPHAACSGHFLIF